MKNFIIFLSICMISNIYAQCDDYSLSQCNNDNSCEWIEDIEIGECSQFDNSENSCTSYPGECYWDEDITYSSCNGYDNNQWACNNAQGCYWDCYYGYCGCNGQEITGVDTECIGQYEIDNGYCEEIEMPECSEMDELGCNSDDNCNWIENITQESCYYTFGSYAECVANGCSWYSPGSYGYMGSHCYGSYQSDNSYCEESVPPPPLECSEMSELECSSDDVCEWVEDIEWGNCSSLPENQCNNMSACSWECTQWGSWYTWLCYGYGCTGGTYQIDNGYCEESMPPPPLECSEMDESECTSSDSCDWVEDMEWGSCSDLNPYMNNGVSYCNDPSTSTDQCYTYTCYGGSYGQWNVCCDGADYLIDNSYCEETEYQLGDLNQDNVINIQDVIIIINLVLDAEYNYMADINHDQRIDVLDIILIVGIILDS